MMTTTSQADINTNTTTNAFINGAIVGGSGDSNIDNDGSGGASSRKSGMPSSANVVNSQNFNIGNSSTGNTDSNNFPNNPNQNNGGGANYQRATGDTVKRKKLKSRNATIPNNIGEGGYSGKNHLDAWLETCLKDASNTQLSSSSEFLDYNPSTTMPSTTVTNNANINKNMLAQQQQQQMSSKQQPQQQSAFQQSFPPSNMHNTNQQQFAFQQQQQQQQQQHQHQQQQFAMRTNIQTPMIHSGAYSNAPFSQGFQRSMPNFMKQSHSFNNRFSMMFPPGIDGGGVSGVGGFYQQNDGSQEFASLPPIVNMMGGSSELENNSTDVLDGSGSNPNISRGFRFSDPCLLNPSDNDSKISGQNTPDPRNHQIPNDMENSKFFSALMEQINLLHETNTKICRNLHETKVDIEALKHAPTWGMRHRRDSLSGLSTHSQPMVFGGGFGTQSPAPTYHSGAYTPGMMTDVVREVKEAARVREDALLNRVKSMVEERQWSMNECNLRMMRDIEELKSQVHHLRVDRKEANKRINHLEAENKYMRQMLANIFNNRIAPDIIYENEALRTRKTYPHSRRTQSLNLHYGTIHHQPPTTSLSVEEQDEASSTLHIIESPSITSTANNMSAQQQEQQLQQQQHQQRPSDMRNSFSSSDGGGSMSGGGGATPLINGLGDGSGSSTVQLMSPPNFALISSTADEFKRKKEQLSNKNAENSINLKLTPPNESANVTAQELQKELHDAVAARKEADNRIIALEKLVKTLRVNANANTTTHLVDDTHITNGGGDSKKLIGGDGIINPCTTTTTITTATTTQIHHKTQQQQQQQHHKAHTIASSSVNMSQSSPKLSVAGPITDL